MGETAENVSERWNVSREAQDEFAHLSQQKYQAAHEAGKFKNEIVPVGIPQKRADPIYFDKDEHPRLSTLEKLSSPNCPLTSEEQKFHSWAQNRKIARTILYGIKRHGLFKAIQMKEHYQTSWFSLIKNAFSSFE